MAQISRQLLTTLIRSFARGAIAQNDQKYGRQLASICEQTALILRAHLGGKATWELTAASRNGKPPPAAPRSEPVTLKVVSDADRWAEEVAIFRVVAGHPKPLFFVHHDFPISARIAKLDVSSAHFTAPILDARRENRALVLLAPDGSQVVIDNLSTGVQN